MRHNPAHFSPTSHICSNHTCKALLQALNTRRQTKREELEAAGSVPSSQWVLPSCSQFGLTLLLPHPHRRTSRLLSPRAPRVSPEAAALSLGTPHPCSASQQTWALHFTSNPGRCQVSSQSPSACASNPQGRQRTRAVPSGSARRAPGALCAHPAGCYP